MKNLLAIILALSIFLGLTACIQQVPKEVIEDDSVESVPVFAEFDPPPDDYSDEDEAEIKALLETMNEETAETFGECGKNLKWYYRDGILAIKGTGDMKFKEKYGVVPWSDIKQKYVEAPWSDLKEKIGLVIIEEGCTSIAGNAFGADGKCSPALYRAILPDSVTVLGDIAFGGCQDLREINMPKNLKHIGSNAFSSTALSSIELPEGLESIGDSVFESCWSMESVRIPKSVTTIDCWAWDYFGAPAIVVPQDSKLEGHLVGGLTVYFEGDPPKKLASVSAYGTIYYSVSGSAIDQLKKNSGDQFWVHRMKNDNIEYTRQ